MSDDLLERARFVVQLFRECDAIQLPHRPTEQVLTGMIDRIEELETKLAKAVDAIEQMRTASDAMMLHIARTTLAELKGGKDDE